MCSVVNQFVLCSVDDLLKYIVGAAAFVFWIALWKYFLARDIKTKLDANN